MQIINVRCRSCNKYFEKILALLRLINKNINEVFFRIIGLILKKSKFWWLPWKHADSLLIQHPITVQQPEFVNICPKLQECIGITKSRYGGGFPLLALGLFVTLVRHCAIKFPLGERNHIYPMAYKYHYCNH